jgi:hypothetical protein
MKMTRFLFTMTSCAALMCQVGYADPVPGAPVLKRLNPVPSGPAQSSLKTARTAGSGAAGIGGPAHPTKAGPFLTGAVNPAKNTAAVNGTGMNHKP